MFLFNDTLNTFYLRLYGVGHMVKDHPDNEKDNSSKNSSNRMRVVFFFSIIDNNGNIRKTLFI